MGRKSYLHAMPPHNGSLLALHGNYLEIEPELEALSRMLLSIEHRADQFGDQWCIEDVRHLGRDEDEVSVMVAKV